MTRSIKCLSEDQQARYLLVKEFFRELGKSTSRKLNTKVSFSQMRIKHSENYYTYTEKEDGYIKGRVTVTVRNEKVVIIRSYVLPEYEAFALRNVNCQDRVKVGKSEKHWKGVYS